ncbi:chromate efflux transporter [Halalkalibacillus halophilus]|uniref:chromate efflux transporter n=1 Tax=Halalkalibacillus halophilus TaxID=392827 RepID=UPI0004017177|nr:chromate efflux transporter [Halalkalibacillus halophilus]
MSRYLEILFVAFRLGLTSFGGPVAHLGYFQNEYVERRNWLTNQMYADLIALCQFLPGPASSQVGISIGILRGGILGGILAWIGFTLPSVIALTVFAYYVVTYDLGQNVFIDALKVVAVAVVAHAIFNMGTKLAPDRKRQGLLVFSAVILLLFPFASVQIIILLVAALVGAFLLTEHSQPNTDQSLFQLPKKVSAISLSLFVGLLAILPILNSIFNNIYLQIADTFYRVGSIVFGGGHVVLPLLERELVPDNLVTDELFLAGYGAAQAVPGPLFTFASYLGTVIHGIPGMLLATIAIFLPSFLLIIGILPFWQKLRSIPYVGTGLLGVNAAVVGILIATFYQPIFVTGVSSALDFAVALFSFALLQFYKQPAWLVVIVTVVVYVVTSSIF